MLYLDFTYFTLITLFTNIYTSLTLFYLFACFLFCFSFVFTRAWAIVLPSVGACYIALFHYGSCLVVTPLSDAEGFLVFLPSLTTALLVALIIVSPCENVCALFSVSCNGTKTLDRCQGTGNRLIYFTYTLFHLLNLFHLLCFLFILFTELTSFASLTSFIIYFFSNFIYFAITVLT